jgi:hypothetical protein
MGLAIHALEALGREVGVDLGPGEVGVAQQFLHAPQIGPGVEQVPEPGTWALFAALGLVGFGAVRRFRRG